MFTRQLERSREATDISNVRSAYAEVMTEYLTDQTVTHSASVTTVQTEAGWQMGASNAVLKTRVNGTEGSVAISNTSKGGKIVVSISTDGTVKTEVQ